MTVIVLVALVIAASSVTVPAAPVPTVPRARRSHRRAPWWLPAVVASLGLGVAGCAAAAAPEPVTGVPLVAVLTLTVLAAVAGGAAVVPAVFHLSRRRPEPGDDDADDDRPVLRGGLVIGTLERIAVVVSILAGWPEGIAVVLAVKGLARYPELRDPRASEYFIIGTFTSVLWALAAGGVGAGLAN